jgi:cell division protein FtsB
MKKLVLLFIAIFTFGLVGPAFVVAQTAAESAEIQELNKQIAAKKETIKQLKKQLPNIIKILLKNRLRPHLSKIS